MDGTVMTTMGLFYSTKSQICLW